MPASGPAERNVVAFDRGGALTVATRRPVALERAGGWSTTELHLPFAGVDLLTGRRHSAGPARVAALLATYPVAHLVRLETGRIDQ
ncbi:MAG: hypothetical protein JO147_04160 [Actinobacteria bacterium]|nr:hypothetical protein [Actinomycetota bacterium]